jgi:hypothetical protein
MTEADWNRSTDPEAMLDWLLDVGKASERKLRLWACGCVRRAWPLLVDRQSQLAVEIGERHADGEASDDELLSAQEDVWQALDEHKNHRNRLTHAEADAATAAFWAADVAYPLCAVLGKLEDATRAAGGHLVERAAHVALARDIFGNPFHAVALPSSVRTWHDATVVRLAQAAYAERSLPAGRLDNARLAVLADALEEAGCQVPEVLTHLREESSHWRGCWVLDCLFGKG